MSTREDILSLSEFPARAECTRRGIDPDEICADGGVTAWMVVDQELRHFAAVQWGDSGPIPGVDFGDELAAAPTPPAAEGDAVTLTYTNWRGETAERSIIPRGVWFGSTEWHPEPQWLLRALDVEKQAERDFALKDFGTPPAAEAPGQEPTADEIDRVAEAMSGKDLGRSPTYWRKVARLGIVAMNRVTPPTYADAEAKGFNRGVEAAAYAVKKAGERVGSLETPAMRGDNLAICLCTHFDDGGDNDGDTGWSAAATDGYEEVTKAIRDHYAAAIRSLASPAPKGET